MVPMALNIGDSPGFGGLKIHTAKSKTLKRYKVRDLKVGEDGGSHCSWVPMTFGHPKKSGVVSKKRGINFLGIWENYQIHPARSTWNLKMMVWKMIFLFKQVIFRFHVHFQGCMSFCFYAFMP